MNERSLSLSVSQRTGGVTLTAPAGAAIAPDGYYMLFLLNDRGIPSVAKWIRLSVDGAPSALPEQPRPGPAPAGTKPKPQPQPLSLSRAAGARLARRALAKEFGRAFRKRTRFRQRCTRPKRAVVSCSVSWAFKPRKHFRGGVKVTRTGRTKYRYSMRVKRNFAGHRLAPVKRRGRL